jgi:hypothetical protein
VARRGRLSCRRSRRSRPGGKLHFDSVYRFKGQQAPAVVLVDVDPDPADGLLGKQVLLCGATRATVRLELLVHAGNPLTRRFLDA